jgi:hypothetical protein
MEKKWDSYSSGLEKTLCKWDMYVPLVTKGLEHKKRADKSEHKDTPVSRVYGA